MKKKYGWINNGTDATPHYDFIEPKEWPNEKLKDERVRVFSDLEDLENKKLGKDVKGWLFLAYRLPHDLRNVLISEIQHGNQLVSLSAENWPTPGSVVARVKFPFHEKNKNFSTGLVWRELKDPHYCHEEISQVVNGTEFILIS